MRRPIICGVYKITSPTGRIYIGKSVDIYARWVDYRKPYYITNTKQPVITRSIKKYGVENHVFEIIEICEEDKLNEREVYWIAFYNSYRSKMGMNCSVGGEGIKGAKWTAAMKKRLSELLKGKFVGEKNPNYGKGIKGEKNPLYGTKKSAEVTEKNKLSNKKTWAEKIKSEEYNSEEQRQKRSEYNRGRTRSEDVKEKTKQKNIETWNKIVNSEEFNSEEEKSKRCDRAKKSWEIYSNSAEYNCEEQRAARSERMRRTWEKMKASGYVRSEETKRKLSESKKLYYKNKKETV